MKSVLEKIISISSRVGVLIRNTCRWIGEKVKIIIIKITNLISIIYNRILKLPWENIFILLACISIGILTFLFINEESIGGESGERIISNILTINGVFSAILITYLFTRVTWGQEMKKELFSEAIGICQKITEYRRILNKLTFYYNVWDNDAQTKSLVDGRFKSIDFYDYRMMSISDYKPKNHELIEELWKHKDFKEGKSGLFLAMVSLVGKRSESFVYHEELYKDFEIKGTYNPDVIEKWINCGISGTITYWLKDDNNWINYSALSVADRDEVKAAAGRINAKYLNYELNNKLIREISEDMEEHYFIELHRTYKELRKGLTGINLILVGLTSISIICGILIPFILFIIPFDDSVIWPVKGVIAINVGMIIFFLLKFPLVMNREMKWI